MTIPPAAAHWRARTLCHSAQTLPVADVSVSTARTSLTSFRPPSSCSRSYTQASTGCDNSCHCAAREIIE
ncbi:uncharacterized protein B0H18DRAFT_991628 [Fomitopsis serialis]|uniref:uncharacterized protein n=1 Tax=Fomitopsis serialis TaxID=139415 RepID=UPI002008EA3F|nr:uncharacterized protein B0H18DRAFT_991628 [Neoantrodia serialis]KAH9930862.1 hypothetical protein B0H18DRAFT_991628 [Neoantrodia serialis]